MLRLLFLAACAASAQTALATGPDRFWNAPFHGGGAFDDLTNWTDPELGIPDADDAAIFDNGPLLSPVTMKSPILTRRLVIRSGEVVFEVPDGMTFTAAGTHPLLTGLMIADGSDAARLAFDGALEAAFATVGSTAAGTLDFRNNAALDCANAVRIGTVDHGEVFLPSGASLSSSRVELGSSGSGSGFLDLTGASLATDTFGVGVGGSAAVIGSDAAITSGSALIAVNTTATGLVDLDGTDWSIDGNLDVGFKGVGDLRVVDGANVSVSGFMALGSSATGPPFPPADQGDGALLISGPSSIVSVGEWFWFSLTGFGRVAISSGGRLVVTGGASADGTATTISVSINGSDDLTTAPITIGTALHLNGVPISIEFESGTEPDGPRSFVIVDVGDGAPEIAYDLPAAPAGLTWQIVTSGTMSTLVLTDQPADINGDGAVNIDDLLILLAEWGTCVDCAADFDADGDVDTDDLLELLGGWTS